MADVNFALAALGAVCTSARTVTGHPPSLAIDGNDVTYSGVNNVINQPSWHKVDLGAEKYITQVQTLHTNLFALDPYRVEASHNDIDYVTLVDARAPIVGWNDWVIGGAWYRYWRIWNSNTNSRQYIYSFCCWGPADAPPPVENPTPDQLTAWLDALHDNYVPTIDTWLALH